MANCWTLFCQIHRPKAASHDRQLLAVTRYSSVSKSKSQYRPFRIAIFVTISQSPPDPPVGYDFTLP